MGEHFRRRPADEQCDERQGQEDEEKRTAQNEKDAAVLSYVQALRTYWTSYYYLRRVTLYDFAIGRELADER